MVKIDEKAVVPPLDDAARGRLAAALDEADVVAAYLFGSQARGEVGPLSDVDVAVWLGPEVRDDRRFDRRLALSAAASRALATDEVDLVVLNDAPPLLRHRVIRDGKLILDRDPRTRVRFETRALLDYLDTAPLRAALSAGRRRRIAEGRFGRR